MGTLRPRRRAVLVVLAWTVAAGLGGGPEAHPPVPAAEPHGPLPLPQHTTPSPSGSEGGVLLSGRVLVDLSGGGREAEVTVEYVLEGGGAGAVEASVLAFGSAEVLGVLVRDGAWVPVRPLSGAAGALLLAGEGEGDVTRVRARYTVARAVVERGGSLRAFVPLVTVDRLPAEARPGLFRAELILPEAWTVSETFPSGLRRAGPAADGAVVWVAELPVVPSMVGFRAHPDLAWHPGLPLVLDLLVGAVLLGFASVGWRHIRGVAR